MTKLEADSIGPVDVAVILFEDGEFNGEVAPALVKLHESGTVRVIDLALVRRDADGSIAVVEIEDSEVADAFQRVNDEPLDLLSAEDLTEAASGLEPGSAALAIVWENTWAAELAAAVRGSKGRLIAEERIPHETVVAALAALDDADR
ncbi:MULTISPECIES: DUF6325 family protein [unclassified Kribbella]|uniref:DUF6325 family protein n=1 Tax=unclassified Kribbella TaxID=2644121 RepID=UPI0033CC84DC